MHHPWERVTICLQVPAGMSIDDACDQAAGLAAGMGLAVSFQFNGTDVIGYPHDTANALSLRYYRHRDRELVTSAPAPQPLDLELELRHWATHLPCDDPGHRRSQGLPK